MRISRRELLRELAQCGAADDAAGPVEAAPSVKVGVELRERTDRRAGHGRAWRQILRGDRRRGGAKR